MRRLEGEMGDHGCHRIRLQIGVGVGHVLVGLTLTDLAPECEFFFFSSRRRHTIFDCDWSSDVCSSDLWLELIHPADRAAAQAAMTAAMRERKQLHNQYRIVRPDGSIGHVESVAAVVSDSSEIGRASCRERV